MRPVKLLPIALMLTGIFFLGKATAQIKIGTNGAIIQPSSLLELESANQGLLLPRMVDTVAINALNPPNGMLIYLTKVPAVGLYVRKTTGWEYLTGSLGGNGNFTSLTVSGVVTAGSFSGPLTGNASSATTASNVTGTIAILNGGTGQTNKSAGFNALSPITTAGDIIYGNGVNSSTRLAAGSNNTFLKGGTIPSWSTINLAAAAPEVTGILPAVNGGTGISNSNTLTLTGGNNVTLTTQGPTNVTLPVSGILVSAVSGSIIHDFPATNTISDITLTVNGATDGDPVSLGIPIAATITVGVYSAWVSAANTVTIRLSSTDGGVTTNPNSGTFKVIVFK